MFGKVIVFGLFEINKYFIEYLHIYLFEMIQINK